MVRVGMKSCRSGLKASREDLVNRLVGFRTLAVLRVGMEGEVLHYPWGSTLLLRHHSSGGDWCIEFVFRMQCVLSSMIQGTGRMSSPESCVPGIGGLSRCGGGCREDPNKEGRVNVDDVTFVGDGRVVRVVLGVVRVVWVRGIENGGQRTGRRGPLR